MEKAIKFIRFIVLSSIVFTLYNCESEEYNELESIIDNSVTETEILSENDYSQLPELIRNYIKRSGFDGNKIPFNIKVSYDGKMKLNENSSWSKSSANIYITAEPLSRIWMGEVKLGFNKVTGYDYYKDGNGRMSIRYFPDISLFENDGPRLDTSELATIIGELPLMPTSFLSSKVTLSTLSDSTVEIRLSDAGIIATGIYYFNKEGILYKVITNNRYKKETDQEPVTWGILYSNYKTIDGFFLPRKFDVFWLMDNEYNMYVTADIKTIKYNIEN